MRIDGATEKEALERFLQATYPGISNPGPRPPGYFTERTIITRRNETVDELNTAFLTSPLEQPTPLQTMTRLSMRPRKGNMLRMRIQAMHLNTW